MNTFADMLFEMEIRTHDLRAEREEDRWARIAAESRSGSRGWGFRRLAVQLGDYLSGLRCLLQSRFATDAGANAC